MTKPLIWNLTKETLCGSRSRTSAGRFWRGKLRQKQRHTRDITVIDLTGTSHWQTTETVASHDILNPGVKAVKPVITRSSNLHLGARAFTVGLEKPASSDSTICWWPRSITGMKWIPEAAAVWRTADYLRPLICRSPASIHTAGIQSLRRHASCTSPHLTSPPSRI